MEFFFQKKVYLNSIANTQTNPSNANNQYRRPVYTSLWTRQPSVDVNNAMYTSGEQQTQLRSNAKPNLIDSLVRSISRTADSIDSNIQNSLSSIHRPEQPPLELPPNYQSTLVNHSQPVQIILDNKLHQVIKLQIILVKISICLSVEFFVKLIFV